MSFLKIAILVIIAISMIGLTIFFVRKEAEKKDKKLYLIYGGIAIISGVLAFLFAFPSYDFISWNKVVIEAGILMFLIGFDLGSVKKELSSAMHTITGIIAGIGIITIVATIVAPINGSYVVIGEESNVITRVSPTVDPIHRNPSIGYSVDKEGNTTYFYYYKHKDIMYRNDISEDYEIQYLTSDEDSYILKDTKTVSYTYSERRDQEPITEVTDTYTLYINSNQMVMINDTESFF